MFPVAQRVDDRHGRVAGKRLQVGVAEHAGNDSVDPERQVPRQIRNAFPLTKTAFG